MTLPIEQVLFVFLLIIAVMVVRLRNLLAAAMLTGLFSLVSASLFTVMDAVDVAFTEAAVGAGFSTVLILGTLALTTSEANRKRSRLLPLVVVIATGATLVYGTFDMPYYGDPGAVVHESTPFYVEATEKQIGIPNVVTGVLGSIRGYDTLGETVVIFTAGIGVLMLLGVGDPRRAQRLRKALRRGNGRRKNGRQGRDRRDQDRDGSPNP